MGAFGESVLDLLFPPSCVACGTVLPGPGSFCEGCVWEVAELPSERCVRCAEPGSFRHRECPRCFLVPPPFAKVHAAFVHEGSVARAIQRFKYEDHPELAAPLAALLFPVLEPALAKGGSVRRVCALPLHPSRRAQRMFDQSELLAGELARRHRLERVFPLERVRPTVRQVGLDERTREQNVKDAFRVRPARAASVAGVDLLLVDDVVTTGATARAAAQALLEAGARTVEVVAIARAYTPAA